MTDTIDTLTPDQRIALVEENLSGIPSMFGATRARESAPNLDPKVYNVNLFDEATLEITDDMSEDEKRDRQYRISKANAELKLFDVLSGNSLSDESKFRKEIEEFQRDYGKLYGSFSTEDWQKVKSLKIKKFLNKVVGEQGILPLEVLQSRQFFENVDENTFAFYTAMYNNSHQGFFNAVERGANLADWNRKLTLQLERGEIDYKEFESQQFRRQRLYSSNLDSEILTTTAGVVQNMASVIRDNKMETAMMLGLALITGGSSLLASLGTGALTSVPFAIDTYQQQQGNILARAREGGSTVDRIDILKRGTASSLASATLDLGLQAITMHLFGLTKLAGKAKTLGASVMQKSGANYIVNKVDSSLAKDVMKTATKILGGSLGETFINEGPQGAFEEMAVNRELGITGSEAWKKVLEAYNLNSSEAWWPSVIINTFFGSVGLMARHIRLSRNAQKLEDNAVKGVQDTLGSKTPLNERDKATNVDLLGKVLPSIVYVDPTQLQDRLQKDGITEVPEFLQEKMSNTRNGDNMVLTDKELKNLSDDIKQSMAGIARDDDGALTPEELRADLTEQDLRKLRAQFREKLDENLQKRREEIEIETELEQGLYKGSKNTTVKQNTSLARLTSSFLRALSESTGIEIKELYNQFKPTYRLHDVENFSSDKAEVEQDNVKGFFDPKTNTISLKKDADFQTAFHETAHWFLNTMRELAKTNSNVSGEMQKLMRWAGMEDRTINSLSEEEFNQLSEKFVAGFVSSLITGDVNVNGMKAFKSFLTSLRNTSLFTGIEEENARVNAQKEGDEQQETLEQTKQRRLKEGFKYAYNENLPDVNADFKNFVDSIFASDVIAEIQRKDYPIDDVLQDIDEANLPDETKEAIKAELREAIKGADAEINELVNTLTIQDMLLNMIAGKDMKKVIGDLINNLPEEQKNNKELMDYLNKLLEATNMFEVKKGKYMKQLAKNKVYKFIAKLGEHKLIPYQVANPEVRENLKEKGLIAEEGEGVTVDALINTFKGEFPTDLIAYIKDSKLPNEQALIEFLYITPKIEEKASQLAMDEVSDTFVENAAKTLANINTAISRNQKKKARAILNALNKVYGKDKTLIDRATKDIETLARLDVDEQIYSTASATRYRGNASKEARKAKENLIQGKVNRAVKATRNEYYQNTKAEYITTTKQGIEKNIRAIRDFLNGSKAYISKNYDMDILEVIKIVMSQTGIIPGRSRFSIAELREAITDKYPDFADSINLMLDHVEQDGMYSSFWQNGTVKQVKDLVQFLNDLKGLAREVKVYRTENETLDIKELIKQLVDSLSDLKDKQNSLNETVNGETVTATNSKTGFVGWLTKLWREYNNATKLPEFEMKKLDGKNMGVWHRYIYLPVEQAKDNYKIKLMEYMNRINDSFAKVQMKSDIIVCDEFRRADTGEKWCLGIGDNRGKATLELIGILLHSGANLDKFLNGYLQDIPNVAKDRQLAEKKKLFEKWLQRMIDEGHITKEMLEFVQTVWDVNREIAPQLQKASRTVRGFPFKPVEFRNYNVKMKDGEVITMRGGYVPALANKEVTGEVNHSSEPDFGEKSAIDQSKNMPLMNPSYLQDRVDNFAQALEIDPFKLIHQTTDTLRYAYVLPAVMKVYRLLETKEIKDLLNKKAPTLMQGVLMPWLKTVASMSNTKPSNNAWANALGKLIQRSSMVIMVGNINNTLQQTSNMATLLLRATPNNVIRAIYEVTCNRENWTKINEESKFMYVRTKERNDGINELFYDLASSSAQFDDKFLKAQFAYKSVSNWGVKNAFMLQKLYQNGLDRVGYLAAKYTALQQGKSEQEAILYAESAVRECFTSLDIVDTSALQKSTPILKAFTMFGGYFYSMYRLAEMGIANAFRDQGISNYKRFFIMLEYMFCAQVFPSLIAEFVQRAVGEGEAWKEDEFMDIHKSAYFLAPIRQTANAFPIVGKITNMNLDKLEGKQYMSSFFLSTPWSTQMTSAVNSIGKIAQGEELKGREVRSLFNAFGILTGIPEFGFLGRPAGFLTDYGRNAVKPDGMYEWIRAPLTGTSAEKGRQTNF